MKSIRVNLFNFGDHFHPFMIHINSTNVGMDWGVFLCWVVGKDIDGHI